MTVNVIGDTVVEPNETFNLTLSAATGAVISDASGTATSSTTTAEPQICAIAVGRDSRTGLLASVRSGRSIGEGRK